METRQRRILWDDAPHMFCTTCSRTSLRELWGAHSMHAIQRRYFQSRNRDGGAWIWLAPQAAIETSPACSKPRSSDSPHPRFHWMSCGKNGPGTWDDIGRRHHSHAFHASCRPSIPSTTVMPPSDVGMAFGRGGQPFRSDPIRKRNGKRNPILRDTSQQEKRTHPSLLCRSTRSIQPGHE